MAGSHGVAAVRLDRPIRRERHHRALSPLRENGASESHGSVPTFDTLRALWFPRLIGLDFTRVHPVVPVPEAAVGCLLQGQPVPEK